YPHELNTRRHCIGGCTIHVGQGYEQRRLEAAELRRGKQCDTVQEDAHIQCAS
ncbi:unnamed protein product, partial [Dicrocoelium dendriticum]